MAQLYVPPSRELPASSSVSNSVPGPAFGARAPRIVSTSAQQNSSAPLTPPGWRRTGQQPASEQSWPPSAPPSSQSIYSSSSDSDSRTAGPTSSQGSTPQLNGAVSVPAQQSQPQEQSEAGAVRRYGSYSSPAAQRAISQLSKSGSATRQVPTSRVTFQLQYHVAYGQVLHIIGSHTNIGAVYCVILSDFCVLFRTRLCAAVARHWSFHNVVCTSRNKVLDRPTLQGSSKIYIN